MNIFRLTLFLSFTVSGFAGLVYESIWSRYLKLFVGHAAYAQSLVLALFMGGLSFGSWLASHYSGRWHNLLRWYAAVEAVIGIFGLVFQPLFEGITELAFTTLMPALGSPSAVGALKLLLSALLILPPSVLLGMTFPLMSAGLIRMFPSLTGSSISTLYFTNSIGAAGGVIASGFFLVGTFGLPGTILAAALLNLIVAAVVYLATCIVHEPIPNDNTDSNEGDTQSADKTSLKPATRYDLMLLVAALTGMASFVYEIGWIRMLSLVLGSSTHSFELMLSAFIAGLAFGGLWIKRRIDTISNPTRYLAIVQIIMGFLALGTIFVFTNSFDLMGAIMKVLSRTDQGYIYFNLASHGVALLMMFPTTFCAGMTLPLITYSLLQNGSGEKSIGTVYASNTVGAIIGVVLSTHIGMPLLGLKGLISFGAAIDLALGATLLWITATSAQRLLPLMAISVSVLALILTTVGIQLDPLKMASGVYRYGNLISEDKAENIFHKDGKTTSVDLVQYERGNLVIFTNGKGEASINLGADVKPAGDEITMVLSAVLPMAIHPHAKTAAVIGMGSGQTSHILLGNEKLQRVDTIEIEEAVIEAAGHFGSNVERVFTDSRSHIFIDDARSFLSTHNSQYDVIVAEPSNPWVSGVSSLFSEEFYELADRHLAPNGVLAQWLQLYEIEARLVASVMGALVKTFPDYAIYATDNANMLILARKGGPQSLDQHVFLQTNIAEELARHQIHSVDDLAIRKIGDRQVLQPFFDSFESPPNSEFHPFHDLNAVKSRFLDHSSNGILALKSSPVPVLDLLASPSQFTSSHTLGSRKKRAAAKDEFTMLQIVQNARTLQRYFDQGRTADLEQLPPSLQRDAQRAFTGLTKCLEPGEGQRWLQSLISIAATINPALKVPELRKFWTVISESNCYSSLPTMGKSWVSLFAAVGERDGHKIATLGTNILPRTSGMPDSWRNYVLAATMAGYLSLEDNRNASYVWERYGRKLTNRPEAEALLFRLLKAHSEI